MNHRQLKKLIKSVQAHVQTDQKWKVQQREVLLHAMRAQTASTNNKEGLKRKMAWSLGAIVARPIGAFAMVLVVMFGSVIASVSASTYSTPGQILYPLKLTTERIQVSLVSDKKEKANLQISFAKKRLQEIKDVVKNEPDQAKVQEKLKQPIESLKTTIASVKIAVEDVKKEDNNKAIDIVSNLKDVANIAAEVAAEPAVAKAVAATEAADQKIVDAKAVSDNADKTNADGADKLNADKTSTDNAVVRVADNSVGAEIKKLVEDTVTSTKDAQASVIRELALKDDKTQAKDEIKKYLDLLKKEREVRKPQIVATETQIANTQILTTTPIATPGTDSKVEEVKTDVVIAPEAVGADATKTAEPVKTVEPVKEVPVAPTKDEIAIADAQKIVDAAAVEDQKKFDEMIKAVNDLLDKGDILGAMKLLGIDVDPNVQIKPETPDVNVPTVDVPKPEVKPETTETPKAEVKTDATATPTTNINSSTTKTTP